MINNKFSYGYKDGYQVWSVDMSCPPPLYRVYGNGIEIFFHAEWRHGSYFKIKSVSYNGKTYQAQRYHYKFIPLIREAVYNIFKEYGLYDYGDNKFHTWAEKIKEKDI